MGQPQTEDSDDELPSGILGVNAYQMDADNAVTDVQIIERDGDTYTHRWLGEDNHTEGIGTPEGWQCIGACANEWSDLDDKTDYTPAGAVAVYVAPDGIEWTTMTLPWGTANEP